ncbi:MAG: PorT family protein [Chlorobi bacterium]|nr:PorT family protein [Chlorobiota bacterium]
MEDQYFDKVIREKMEGFTPSPPANAFSNIKAQMEVVATRKRRAVFIRIAMAAALIGIAMITGWLYTETDNQGTKPLAEDKTIQKEEGVVTESNKKESTTYNPKKTVAVPAKETIVKSAISEDTRINNYAALPGITDEKEAPGTIRESMGQLNYLTARLIQVIPFEDRSEALRLNTVKKGTFSTPLSEDEKELIAMNTSANRKNDMPANSWKVGIQLAPGYSSNTSSHSEYYAQNMAYSGSPGKTNMGAGFSIAYKANKKWSIKSGLYYSQNGQDSKNSRAVSGQGSNLFFTQAPADKEIFNTAVNFSGGQMTMNSKAGIIEFTGTPQNTELLTTMDGKRAYSNTLLTQGEFSQMFDFVEIPLYLSYQLLKSKIGIELLGGISANFLVGNNVYMNGPSGKENIGRTADISTLNYSGTLGAGVEYALGENISFSVEPRFSYFLNSINKRSDVRYRPYRIGIYIGLNYELNKK